MLIGLSKATKFVKINDLGELIHISDIEKTENFIGNLEFCT